MHFNFKYFNFTHLKLAARGALKYLLAFLTLPIVVGLVNILTANPPQAALQLEGAYPPAPVLALDKPTIAIVVGRDDTEISDVIAPYVVFKSSAAFNVVTVAETRRPTRLTGGLEILPDFTFTELNQVLGRSPAVIVVPNIPDIDANAALRRWVRDHGRGSSITMSICAGAAMLAATGLLDGQRATSHWGDILWIEGVYPQVNWLRGLRYVDNGRTVSTAGVLSGIDGALHLIARLRGPDLARRVASEFHYAATYLEDPTMRQLMFQPSDAIFPLNILFRWERSVQAVALYDGVDELALSALYDTPPPMLPSRLTSLAPAGRVVIGKFGLQLVARRNPKDWPVTSTVLIPDAPSAATPAWLRAYPTTHTLARADQFPFDATLGTLAQTLDVPSAVYSARRLEHRMGIELEGAGWLGAGWLHRR